MEKLPKIVTTSVPGPESAKILRRRNAAVPKALCGTTYPVVIKQGSGAVFEDVDGNTFLDWIGGVGVLNIGYSHPEVVAAVQAQAEKYFHTIFNIVGHKGYVTLAEGLNKTVPCKKGESGAVKTYFANSGAECDENAIKVAKAYTGRSIDNYISLKTVKPNIDQTAVVKEDCLHLTIANPNCKTYFGLPYNPY